MDEILNRVAKANFDGGKDLLISVWEPTASPEFISLEECWNISKDDLLAQFAYSSYGEFTGRVGEYFRTGRFNLDIRRYVLREAG